MRTRFGEFVVDTRTRIVERAGAPVHLTRKAFELLQVLIAERPRVVSKRELLERVWPDAIVSPENLKNLIVEVRDALGETRSSIRTVHGVGYAFAAEARDDDPAAAEPLAWLYYDDRALPIVTEATCVGRGDDCDVRIDALGVSRRHARIIIAPDGASLEDLGSKNGTHVGQTRVTCRIPLHDGDRISLGSARLFYRERSVDRSTITDRLGLIDARADLFAAGAVRETGWRPLRRLLSSVVEALSPPALRKN